MKITILLTMIKFAFDNLILETNFEMVLKVSRKRFEKWIKIWMALYQNKNSFKFLIVSIITSNKRNWKNL